MESVNKKVILIAVIMALATSFLIYVYIKKATTSVDTTVYLKAYVAVKTLPAKYKVTDADLKEIKVAKEMLNPKAVQNKSDIVGKRLRDKVIEGEEILSDRLTSDDISLLSFNIPTGKRAVSVNVNEQVEVGNLIKPGDFVDVIVSFDKDEVDDKINKTIFNKVTKIILQNVQILSIGQEQTVTDDKNKDMPKTVTLAVSPEDSEKLVYASEYGVLRLALRAVDDKSNVDTEGITREELAPSRTVKTVPSSGK